MTEDVDEREVATAVSRAKAWLQRLEPNVALDAASGFTSDDLFVLSYAISARGQVAFGLPDTGENRTAIFNLSGRTR